MSEWAPLSDFHLCEYVAPLDCTEGGIHLPDRSQVNNTTVVVLASGPGLPLAEGRHSVQWVGPGDVVLVDGPTTKLAPGLNRVFVRDGDLLALMDGDEVRPLNDWVWVDPDRGSTTTQSGLAIPDAFQRRRGRSGTVRAIGSGKVCLQGKRRGLRIPVSATMVPGVNPGDRVHWEHESNAVAVGRHHCAGLLVRAEHICCVEVNGNADRQG